LVDQKHIVDEGKIVDRKEAIAVLRDVLAECAGSLLERCVSLSSVKPVNPKTLIDFDQYEVRISCMVDDDLRRCIDTVVNKHKVSMRQEGNVVIIYRPSVLTDRV
jgi:hypothetical protein